MTASKCSEAQGAYIELCKTFDLISQIITSTFIFNLNSKQHKPHVHQHAERTRPRCFPRHRLFRPRQDPREGNPSLTTLLIPLSILSTNLFPPHRLPQSSSTNSPIPSTTPAQTSKPAKSATPSVTARSLKPYKRLFPRRSSVPFPTPSTTLVTRSKKRETFR